MALELQDGYVCEGRSFGAEKSVAGELVFQTGMVGYPESITDPSYRGQILVVTYPLVGNYGVPSREEKDQLLQDVPAHFESAEIHIAGLVVAEYADEDFSHHLASSSLGKWLQEQGVPAICGVDTRALTKRIREEGSMLGRLLKGLPSTSSTIQQVASSLRQLTTSADAKPVDGAETPLANGARTPNPHNWKSKYEEIEWADPNTKNLVKEGKF